MRGRSKVWEMGGLTAVRVGVAASTKREKFSWKFEIFGSYFS
jgi:hypothetical protein